MNTSPTRTPPWISAAMSLEPAENPFNMPPIAAWNAGPTSLVMTSTSDPALSTSTSPDIFGVVDVVDVGVAHAEQPAPMILRMAGAATRTMSVHHPWGRVKRLRGLTDMHGRPLQLVTL
jgi:hypothetical protein